LGGGNPALLQIADHVPAMLFAGQKKKEGEEAEKDED